MYISMKIYWKKFIMHMKFRSFSVENLKWIGMAGVNRKLVGHGLMVKLDLCST